MTKIIALPVEIGSHVTAILFQNERQQIIDYLGIENPRCPAFREQKDNMYIAVFQEDTIEAANALIKEINEANRNNI